MILIGEVTDNRRSDWPYLIIIYTNYTLIIYTQSKYEFGSKKTNKKTELKFVNSNLFYNIAMGIIETTKKILLTWYLSFIYPCFERP